MGEGADVKLCDADLIGEDVDGWQHHIQKRQHKGLLHLLEQGEHLLALRVSSRSPGHQTSRRGLLLVLRGVPQSTPFTFDMIRGQS